MFERRSQNDDEEPRAANRGLARPPAIYLAAIVAGSVLHSVWPMPFASKWAMPFGLLIVLLAASLFIWSIKTLYSAHTPVQGNRPTTAIVTVGPYRFSRNPIYLAFSAFQVGIAISTNSAWLLVTLVPAIALMSVLVIPREERYLLMRFAEEYGRYRVSVRRWL